MIIMAKPNWRYKFTHVYIKKVMSRSHGRSDETGIPILILFYFQLSRRIELQRVYWKQREEEMSSCHTRIHVTSDDYSRKEGRGETFC